MAGSSSTRDAGFSIQRAMSPASPGGSDIGSVTSGMASRTGNKPYNLTNRLGTLHGAGLSSLQLALGEEGSASGAAAAAAAASGLTGFNAISTLLNNPNRPQRPIDPSSSRYPAISQSHTDLPKVKRSDYEGYINSTQKEWNRFQRNLKLGSRGKARLEVEEAEAGEDGVDNRKQSRQSLDQMEVDHTAAIGKKKLPPLSTVPQVFFAEDFDLGNPYTFDLVTERYKVAGAVNSTPTRNGASPAPGSGYDVALNQMLQEKLSYYSDVVEQHLILEISARSSSFFAALGNLQDLETEASQCLRKVEHLKAELEDKEEGIAKAGLRVIREQAKRREMVEKLEAVGILQMLCEKRDLCRLLVQNGEWNEALDVMDLLRNIVEGREKLQNGDSSLPPHVDLDFASIKAVKAFVPQLEEMRGVISSQLETELLSILSRDLVEQIGEPQESKLVAPVIDTSIAAIQEQESGASGVLSSKKESIAPPTLQQDDVTRSPATDREVQLQRRITEHLKGLMRTQGVDQVMAAYRDVALKATKTTLRTYLCASEEMKFDDRRDDLATLLEDDEAASGKADIKLSPGGVEAASNLRNMAHNHFLDMTRLVFVGLTNTIKGVDMQTKVVLRVLAEAGQNEAEDVTVGIMMPVGVSPSLPTTLSTTVSDICGFTHILSSRLMSLRSSTHVALPLSDFLAVFHLCWTFVLQSETICNRMIIGLRGVVLNQAKAWLANFHKIRIERAARAVEEEMWGQAEVLEKQQKHIELIVDSATSDPPALIIAKEELIKGAESTNGEAVGDSVSTEKQLRKTLEIEERQYFVVGATLEMLELLLEYLRVVINLPLLSTETMGRVVEFSKQFNSRTCQVVLGAGAMRSAGLKNITAKHLALASQSLSIMITLIPYIRETVRRHLSPKQAVMLIEFDKLKRDYQEHQYEIHSKLVAIMSDRLTVHCRALASVQWNAGDNKVEPIKPVADLTKETTTLHRVLCKYLQPSVVENVIGQVLTSIDKRISAEFQKVEVQEEAAIQKMTTAKSFFDEKFKALKNVDWSAKELEEVIEEQKTALEKHRIAIAPPPPPPVEKKETVPAYKPRIPLFGRKSHQAPSTTSNGRASTESTEARVAEENTAPTVEVEVEASKVTEKTPASLPESVEEAGIIAPAAKVAVLDHHSPPPTPSKDGEATPNTTSAVQVEAALPSPPRQSVEITNDVGQSPASASPATPEKNLRDAAVTSPTPSTGRMTLQQRLAEAARRRAQGSNSRPSNATTENRAGPSSEVGDVRDTPISAATVPVSEASSALTERGEGEQASLSIEAEVNVERASTVGGSDAVQTITDSEAPLTIVKLEGEPDQKVETNVGNERDISKVADYPVAVEGEPVVSQAKAEAVEEDQIKKPDAESQKEQVDEVEKAEEAEADEEEGEGERPDVTMTKESSDANDSNSGVVQQEAKGTKKRKGKKGKKK